jgi:hypothetical protein
MWITAILVVIIIVILSPNKHTDTPVYHEAVERWFLLQPLYLNGSFFYFPQFILLFMPFHFLPFLAGDVLWRVFSAALLCWGLRRILKSSDLLENERFFLYASLVAISSAVGALRNGQANLIFGALGLHAAASLARSRWWTASLCLIGALAIKPLGIVMLFLALIVYRPMAWRLALGLIIFLTLPLLFTDPLYVITEYQQALAQLSASSLTTEHRFADFNGLLRSIGCGLTGVDSQVVRIGAGVLTGILCLFSVKRTREPDRALLLLGLTSVYLMLFNPMTQGNSYVVVGPLIAVYAVRFLWMKNSRKIGLGLLCMGVSLGPLPTELCYLIDDNFRFWWRPLMMIIFAVFLTYTIFRAEDTRGRTLNVFIEDKNAFL